MTNTRITPEWFAGFVDGEGTLGIHTHGGIRLQPRFRLNQRDDDGALVRQIHDWLGVGYVGSRQAKPTDKFYSENMRRQTLLVVVGSDCMRVVDVLDSAPLRSKKRLEYPIWRQAVIDYSSHRARRSTPNILVERDSRLWVLKRDLENIRLYGGPS